MSNLDGLDRRMIKALAILAAHTYPVRRELPKRIFEDGVLVYETPKAVAYPGAIYKEYLSNLDDDGTDP